jgi:hypothetical protein
VPRAILRRHGLAGKRRAEGCGGRPGAPARVRGSVERGTGPRATGVRRRQVGRGRAARGRPSGPGGRGWPARRRDPAVLRVITARRHQAQQQTRGHARGLCDGFSSHDSLFDVRPLKFESPSSIRYEQRSTSTSIKSVRPHSVPVEDGSRNVGSFKRSAIKFRPPKICSCKVCMV